MKRYLPLLIFLAAARPGQAHFVFVVPGNGGNDAKVFISEELKPDNHIDQTLVEGAKLNLREANGAEQPLTLVKHNDALLVVLPGKGTRLVYGIDDLGLSGSQASAKPYRLIYYPKAILGDAFDPQMTVGSRAPVELIPEGKPGAVRLRLVARGKPLPNTEITVILPDGSQKKMMTDASGQTEPMAGSGRFGAWARFWENASGEQDRNKYEEVRNYATLVFDSPAPAAITSGQLPVRAAPFVTALPQAVASFGAVVSNGWLYVYGGHVAATHSYSTEAVSGQFHRLNLQKPQEWDQLPGGPGLQGMNLAAWNGKIYRIGGMGPRNQPGQSAEMYSTAECARFDPALMRWDPLPPLPEPRSSHDVVVIGSQLIVTGGWAMEGSAGQKWMDTLAVLDVAAEKPEWRSLAQPFKRRALIAAAWKGRMYVMGGITDKGAIVQDVDIYDPGTNMWTKGPGLPGTGINAFAPAATVYNGSLYVSVADGTLYRLNESMERWDEMGRATPRVAHRLVSDGKVMLVMGGAAAGKDLSSIEAITPASPAAE